MLVLGKKVARMEVAESRGRVFTVYVMSVCGTHGTITIKRSCEENQRKLYRGAVDDCWKEWKTIKANLIDEGALMLNYKVDYEWYGNFHINYKEVR